MFRSTNRTSRPRVGPRRRRWLIVKVVAIPVLMAWTFIGAREWAARELLRAPNASGVQGGELPEGVRPVEVDVGPPMARLSLWVVDPPEAVTATLLGER